MAPKSATASKAPASQASKAPAAASKAPAKVCLRFLLDDYRLSSSMFKYGH